VNRTNSLAIAAANACVLGIISTSGFETLRVPPERRRQGQEELCKSLSDGKGGTWKDEMVRAFHHAKEETGSTNGIFGTNVIVAAESADYAKEVIKLEDEGWDAQFQGDGPKALMPGGEVAGMIDDIPAVADLVDEIMKEAEDTIAELPRKFLVE
jgi:NAD(P)H-dependent flavin oxidoreductase YrpB (nitropropane dioxygenase family)